MDAKDYQVIAAQVLKILKKDKKEQGIWDISAAASKRDIMELQSAIAESKNSLEKIITKNKNDTDIKLKDIEKEIVSIKSNLEKEIVSIKSNLEKKIVESKKKNNSLGLFDELACVCQLINKIVQKHWEFFQYKQEEIILSDILQLFLKEVDEAMMLWDSFIYKFEIFLNYLSLRSKALKTKNLFKFFFKKIQILKLV